MSPLAPRSAPGKASPGGHQGFRPMTREPGPTRHIGRLEARRRQTTTQGARNRPVVMRPFIFGATSGREDEFRTGSVQPPRGCALPRLRYNRRSNMRTQAHMSCNRRAGYWVRKNRTAARANATSSRGHHKKLKNKFSEPVQRLEAARAWPSGGIKYENHRPVNREPVKSERFIWP